MSKLTDTIGVKYLRESKEELQKVTWPSQKDTIRYSIIVAIISVASGLYFGVADWALAIGMEELVKLTQ